MSPTEV